MKTTQSIIASCLFAGSLLSFADFAHAEPNYRITITNPSEARAYQRPGQAIEVMVDVEPNPATTGLGDRLAIFLDDVKKSDSNTALIPTVELIPGEHTIKASVLTNSGDEVVSTSQNIYVITNTAVIRDQRAKAAARANYEAQPWYKKLYLNLRQDVNIPEKNFKKSIGSSSW